MTITSKALNVPIEKICSKSRLRIHTEPRAIVTILARDEGISLQRIGDAMGGRTHGAPLHLNKAGRQWLSIDKQFKQKFNLVKSLIDDSYEDYINDDLRDRAFIKIEACILRVNNIMNDLNEELKEITALKSELNK